MSEWWDCENGHANQILYQTPYSCESCDALYDGFSGYSVDDGFGDPCEEEICSAEDDPPPRPPHRTGDVSQPGCPEACAGPHEFSVAVETEAFCVVGETHEARAHVDPAQPGYYEWSVEGDVEFDGSPAGEDLSTIRFLPAPNMTQQLIVRVAFTYGVETFNGEGYVEVDALQLSIETEETGVYGRDHALRAVLTPDVGGTVTWSLRKGKGSLETDGRSATLSAEPSDLGAEWETLEVVAAMEAAGETVQAVANIAYKVEVGNLAGIDDVMDPDGMQLGHGGASGRLNTLPASTPLPWTDGGWNATEILSRLGQYDRTNRTDSDSSRCVQAMALGNHILGGPGAVVTFLRARRDGDESTARRRASLNIMSVVAARVARRVATYGDLSWAQEGLHAYYIEDDEAGTPPDRANDVVVTPDRRGTLKPLDVWYETVEEFRADLPMMAPNERLVCMAWKVKFNAAYRSGSATDATPPEIDTSSKPSVGDIDGDRDHMAGHQLLLHRGPDGIFVYDPEDQTTGDHYQPERAILGNYFKDDPPTFGYVSVKGAITP